jgi:hypothetical protein
VSGKGGPSTRHDALPPRSIFVDSRSGGARALHARAYVCLRPRPSAPSARVRSRGGATARVSFRAPPGELVTLYLVELADRGKVAGIARALSAINQAHLLAGHPRPRSCANLREVLQGIPAAPSGLPECRRRPSLSKACAPSSRRAPARAGVYARASFSAPASRPPVRRGR